MDDFLCVSVVMIGDVDEVMLKTALIHGLTADSGRSMFYEEMNDFLHSYRLKEKGSSDIWV